jgi:hypothetical protein
MFRISELPVRNGAATLRLEGRLVGPWVAEAGPLCNRLLDELFALKLDLTDLSYVDRNGAMLLVRLRARGVSFVNSSPFVEEQLKSVAPL